MAEWWDDAPDERYWVEITARSDIGTDLHAPAASESASSFWSYDLITAPEPGDLVYHYDSKHQAIVGYSEIVGGPWSDEIVWAAKGASARRQGITPYVRKGIRRGLGGYVVLDIPVTKALLIERRAALFAVRDAVADRGFPSRFPFIPYGAADVRAIQGYLTKLPSALFEVFPELIPQTVPAPSAAPANPPKRGLGAPYRPANEELAVGVRDPFEVDPALVERALRGHARTQNMLASYVVAIGGVPLSPVVGGPNYDIAWEQDGNIWVAEVKSCTPANMENQLRLGLGQILRYRSVLAHRLSKPVQAMLAVEREPDASWKSLCAELGVELRWLSSIDIQAPEA